jgi:hypothetical protein
MRLTMKERKKAVVVVAPRYQKARKKNTGLIQAVNFGRERYM